MQPMPPTNLSLPASITTANTGTGASFELHFTREYTSDWYRLMSNHAAESAMRFGLAGYETTAAICAELADAYALLAEQWEYMERMT